MKRLFTVKSTYTTVVLAEDEEHAKKVWRKNRRDIADEADINPDDFELTATEINELPPDWEPHALPWNDNNGGPELTVSQILENQGKP